MQNYSRKTREDSLLHKQVSKLVLQSVSNSKHDMAKPTRSILENQVIHNYLNQLQGLVNLAKQSSGEYILMGSLSSQIRYEKVSSKKILFKTGDEGDKFYIIFEGRVSVLLPYWHKIEMSEEEYIVYLAKLKRFDEIEIFNKCKNLNKSIFKIDYSNFEDFLEEFLAKNEKLPEEARNEIKLTINSSKTKNKTKKFFNKSHLKILNAFNLDNHTLDLDTHYASIHSEETYINQITPLMFSKENKNVTDIYLYDIEKSLCRGEIFGEKALISHTRLRAATCVTADPCLFGVLNKEQFDKCLKDTFDKINRSYMSMLISTPLFKKCNKHIFIRNYLDYFYLQKATRNSVIMTENTTHKWAIIIKEGEFEVQTKRSLNEINHILETFGELNIRTIQEKKLRARFEKYMNEKKIIRMAIIKEGDVIGLEDCIFDGSNAFTVQCVSNTAEYFKIDYNYFKSALKDTNLESDIEKFISIKKKYVIDRLCSFKAMRYKFLEENKTPGQLLLSNKPEPAVKTLPKLNFDKFERIETKSDVRKLTEHSPPRKTVLTTETMTLPHNFDETYVNSNTDRSLVYNTSLTSINHTSPRPMNNLYIKSMKKPFNEMTICSGNNTKFNDSQLIKNKMESSNLESSIEDLSYVNLKSMSYIKMFPNKTQKSNIHMNTSNISSMQNSILLTKKPFKTLTKKSPNSKVQFAEAATVDCLAMDSFNRSYNPELFVSRGVKNASKTHVSISPPKNKNELKVDFLVNDECFYKSVIDSNVNSQVKKFWSKKNKREERLKNLYCNVVKKNSLTTSKNFNHRSEKDVKCKFELY